MSRRSPWLRWKAQLSRWQKAVARWLPWRRRSLGERGEQAACRFLRRLGYKIVERGARPRYGEIDLVAIDGRVVVFVEVKTRASHEGGHPAEAVGTRKQQRLSRAARLWLRWHRLTHLPARFDVVAITWRPEQRHPAIEHVRNAFEAWGEE